ncbi:unnamed protein product [Meloidogyne enterolobii]|uniref:Uncharacterized protein n=1 Tax=Meloidogyne enterolobii TaxID=390850 RepID=A0ACB0Y9G4_MELEN
MQKRESTSWDGRKLIQHKNLNFFLIYKKFCTKCNWLSMQLKLQFCILQKLFFLQIPRVVFVVKLVQPSQSRPKGEEMN